MSLNIKSWMPLEHPEVKEKNMRKIDFSDLHLTSTDLNLSDDKERERDIGERKKTHSKIIEYLVKKINVI